MSLKFSTALRNKLLGKIATVSGTRLTLTASSNRVADSSNGLLDLGFRPSDVVQISNSGASNDGYFSVTSVQTDGSYMTISSVTGDESSDADLQVDGMGKGFKEIFRHAILDIYSGSCPSDADSAETGTKLVSITVDGGTLTKGTSTNGLDWETPSAGAIAKSTSETWEGTAAATGTAGYFVLYDNAYDTGADTDAYAIRLMGTVGTSGTDLELTSTSITSGEPVTVSSASFTCPAS